MVPVMMPFTTTPRSRDLASRCFGGAGLLLLLIGVVFAPLYSVLSLCTMPCCHHASSHLASVASQLPCCAISGNDTANDAVAISPASTEESILATVEIAAALTFASVPNASAVTEFAPHVFRPVDRPLYVLNCVFLI